MISWFSRERRAREDAARWAIRRSEDASDPDGRFAAWLARDPSHAALYQACSETWADPVLAEALSAMRPVRLARAPRQSTLPMAVAAAFTSLLIVAGFLVKFYLPGIVEPAPEHFETRAGESLSRQLADGSRIELNGDSALTVALSGRQRSLVLERGEAFFDVAHDPKRPLTVTAGSARVTVLGTAFDVDLSRSEVGLAVYRGKVDFAQRDDAQLHMLVTAGQRASLTDGSLRRETDFNPEGGDWRSGWLDSDGMTLAQLVEHLNRLSPRPIEITEPRLQSLRIAGRLHIAEPDQLLTRLAGLYHFHVREKDGRILLTP
jgi:transmembrane sensor